MLGKNTEMKLYKVTVDLIHFDQRHMDVYMAYLKIWLRRHCHHAWFVSVIPLTSITINFSDPKEAIYFKLSSLFDIAQRPILCNLINSRFIIKKIKETSLN